MNRRISRLAATAAVVAIAGLALAACSGGGNKTALVTPAAKSSYVPVTRNLTLVTTPLLVHEETSIFDWAKKDFAAGGVLDGKEVYGFYPDTLVVYAGDTVNLTIVNPEDDAHTFTVPDLSLNVNLPGQSSGKTTFTASKAGVFQFACEIPEHVPYMWGSLVVLPDSAAG